MSAFDCDDAIPSDYFASLYHQAKAQNADIVYAAYNNLLHRIGQIKAPQDKYRVLKTVRYGINFTGRNI